ARAPTPATTVPCPTPAFLTASEPTEAAMQTDPIVLDRATFEANAAAAAARLEAIPAEIARLRAELGQVMAAAEPDEPRADELQRSSEALEREEKRAELRRAALEEQRQALHFQETRARDAVLVEEYSMLHAEQPE